MLHFSRGRYSCDTDALTHGYIDSMYRYIDSPEQSTCFSHPSLLLLYFFCWRDLYTMNCRMHAEKECARSVAGLVMHPTTTIVWPPLSLLLFLCKLMIKWLIVMVPTTKYLVTRVVLGINWPYGCIDSFLWNTGCQCICVMTVLAVQGFCNGQKISEEWWRRRWRESTTYQETLSAEDFQTRMASHPLSSEERRKSSSNTDDTIYARFRLMIKWREKKRKVDSKGIKNNHPPNPGEKIGYWNSIKHIDTLREYFWIWKFNQAHSYPKRIFLASSLQHNYVLSFTSSTFEIYTLNWQG